jgi:hypothetical protein
MRDTGEHVDDVNLNIQRTLMNWQIVPVCKMCGDQTILFEHWYADNYEPGLYCELCIEGEYDV